MTKQETPLITFRDAAGMFNLECIEKNNEVHVTGSNYQIFLFMSYIFDKKLNYQYLGAYSEGFHGSPVFKRFKIK